MHYHTSTAQAWQNDAIAVYSTRGCDLTVHEAALADIGVATDKECAGVGVDGRQPAHVLPDLLQVPQAGRLLLHDCAHAPLQHNLSLTRPHSCCARQLHSHAVD